MPTLLQTPASMIRKQARSSPRRRTAQSLLHQMPVWKWWRRTLAWRPGHQMRSLQTPMWARLSLLQTLAWSFERRMLVWSLPRKPESKMAHRTMGWTWPQRPRHRQKPAWELPQMQGSSSLQTRALMPQIQTRYRHQTMTCSARQTMTSEQGHQTCSWLATGLLRTACLPPAGFQTYHQFGPQRRPADRPCSQPRSPPTAAPLRSSSRTRACT